MDVKFSADVCFAKLEAVEAKLEALMLEIRPLRKLRKTKNISDEDAAELDDLLEAKNEMLKDKEYWADLLKEANKSANGITPRRYSMFINSHSAITNEAHHL